MTYATSLEALGDGTRRELMELLRRQPHAVGELATALRVSQPAVSQHLRVLEHARLVAYRRDGKRRIYTVAPEGLTDLRAWIESFWTDVLSAFAAEDPHPPSPYPTPQRRTLRPARRSRGDR